MDEKAVSQPQSQHQAELHATTLPRASTLAHATVAELGGNAVMRDRLLRAHFFNPVSQFSTTVMGEGAISVASVLNRKRFPSAATSYL